jgi:hypothetical protein
MSDSTPMDNTIDKTSKRFFIRNGDQIPRDWGKVRAAVRKTTVAMRETRGSETFVTSWGTLTATPGLDCVIVQDSGEEYPIKKEIFAATYEEVEPGRYRKRARSRLVQVPEGVIAVLATKEGKIEVRHPDYVVIGVENEVYANAKAWVTANLELLPIDDALLNSTP